MTSLVELAELAKTLPDNDVIKAVNGGSSLLPPYLALGEMERRTRAKAMAKGMASSSKPRTTVVEDMMGLAAPAQQAMPPQGGQVPQRMMGPAAPMQQAMPPQSVQAPQQEPPVRGFADGGGVYRMGRYPGNLYNMPSRTGPRIPAYNPLPYEATPSGYNYVLPYGDRLTNVGGDEWRAREAKKLNADISASSSLSAPFPDGMSTYFDPSAYEARVRGGLDFTKPLKVREAGTAVGGGVGGDVSILPRIIWPVYGASDRPDLAKMKGRLNSWSTGPNDPTVPDPNDPTIPNSPNGPAVPGPNGPTIPSGRRQPDPLASGTPAAMAEMAATQKLAQQAATPDDPDGLDAISDMLAKSYASLDADLEDARLNAQLMAGLSIMGGTSPFAMENIGKGAQAGLGQFMQNKSMIEDKRSDLEGRIADEQARNEDMAFRQKQFEYEMYMGEQKLALDRASLALSASRARAGEAAQMDPNLAIAMKMLDMEIESKLKVAEANGDTELISSIMADGADRYRSLMNPVDVSGLEDPPEPFGARMANIPLAALNYKIGQ